MKLEIREKFCMMKVVKHCYRLPKEVGDAPSLEADQGWSLDGALSNLVKLKMSLLTAAGWTR